MAFSPSLLYRPVLIMVGLLIATSALANVNLNIDLGYSMPSASNYQGSSYRSVSLGYQSGQWLGRVGSVDVGEFELEDSDGGAQLNTGGPFVMVSRLVQRERVSWELGVGAARLESDATLRGVEFRSESNWEPMVELAVHKSLSQRWKLKGGYTYFHDVVGSNVSVVALGMRWSF